MASHLKNGMILHNQFSGLGARALWSCLENVDYVLVVIVVVVGGGVVVVGKYFLLF